jgi:hypothetical protein
MRHTARYGPVVRYHEPPPEPAFGMVAAEWFDERVVGFVGTS